MDQHRAEVRRTDRRWLLAWTASFIAVFGGLVLGRKVYRATGPHPEVAFVIRRIQHHARWLIPGLKKWPKPRKYGS